MKVKKEMEIAHYQKKCGNTVRIGYMKYIKYNKIRFLNAYCSLTVFYDDESVLCSKDRLRHTNSLTLIPPICLTPSLEVPSLEKENSSLSMPCCSPKVSVKSTN